MNSLCYVEGGNWTDFDFFKFGIRGSV
jgi:hypothetical protein